MRSIFILFYFLANVFINNLMSPRKMRPDDSHSFFGGMDYGKVSQQTILLVNAK